MIPAEVLAGGEVPLHGHAAFIRLSVLEEMGFWNEEAVTEDLDFSMRARARGYHGRYIAFPGMDFRDEVPTTITEDIRRVARYAYGDMQVLLNPAGTWLSKGIFAHPIRQIMGSSSLTGPQKIVSLLGYIRYLLLSASILTTFLGVLSPSSMVLQGVLGGTLFFATSGIPIIFYWLVRKSAKEADGGVQLPSYWEVQKATAVFGFLLNAYSFRILLSLVSLIAGHRPNFGATAVGNQSAVTFREWMAQMKKEHQETVFRVLMAGVQVIALFVLDKPEQVSWMFVFGTFLSIFAPYIGNPHLAGALIREFRGGAEGKSSFGSEPPSGLPPRVFPEASEGDGNAGHRERLNSALQAYAKAHPIRGPPSRADLMALREFLEGQGLGMLTFDGAPPLDGTGASVSGDISINASLTRGETAGLLRVALTEVQDVLEHHGGLGWVDWDGGRIQFRFRSGYDADTNGNIVRLIRRRLRAVQRSYAYATCVADGTPFPEDFMQALEELMKGFKGAVLSAEDGSAALVFKCSNATDPAVVRAQLDVMKALITERYPDLRVDFRSEDNKEDRAAPFSTIRVNTGEHPLTEERDDDEERLGRYDLFFAGDGLPASSSLIAYVDNSHVTQDLIYDTSVAFFLSFDENGGEFKLIPSFGEIYRNVKRFARSANGPRLDMESYNHMPSADGVLKILRRMNLPRGEATFEPFSGTGNLTSAAALLVGHRSRHVGMDLRAESHYALDQNQESWRREALSLPEEVRPVPGETIFIPGDVRRVAETADSIRQALGQRTVLSVFGDPPYGFNPTMRQMLNGEDGITLFIDSLRLVREILDERGKACFLVPRQWVQRATLRRAAARLGFDMDVEYVDDYTMRVVLLTLTHAKRPGLLACFRELNKARKRRGMSK
ncbi:MAG: glycosyltransferase family 2 protein [Elusimicrobia bacterium]|nr:glycosyltransferase family 2 protein [Elusimicrobiota bacterium]